MQKCNLARLSMFVCMLGRSELFVTERARVATERLSAHSYTATVGRGRIHTDRGRPNLQSKGTWRAHDSHSTRAGDPPELGAALASVME